MPSLDIVSEINLEEVRNATSNATKELATRFDFRGVEASFEWKSPVVSVSAELDFQINQLMDILRSNLAKRNIDAKAMTYGSSVHSGKTFTSKVTFKELVQISCSDSAYYISNFRMHSIINLIYNNTLTKMRL